MNTKVYEARNSTDADMVASALRSAGIQCEVRDSIASTYLPIAVNPTVWIFERHHLERAQSIIETAIKRLP